MTPPVVILCGGRGTRLQEQTAYMPKPLVEIGGRPILAHVLEIYSSQGFDEAILATGYKGEMIEEYISGSGWERRMNVSCVDTGEETPTGGRLWRLRNLLDGGMFCATYADGVADIDLRALLEFHQRQGTIGSVTVVRPRLPWGVARLNGDSRVDGFAEKPLIEEWINGGFFCFQTEAFDYLGQDTVLEQEPLAGLASDGQLSAYRHRGFWECMDTYKDAVKLNDLCAGGSPPWLEHA